MFWEYFGNVSEIFRGWWRRRWRRPAGRGPSGASRQAIPTTLRRRSSPWWRCRKPICRARRRGKLHADAPASGSLLDPRTNHHKDGRTSGHREKSPPSCPRPPTHPVSAVGRVGRPVGNQPCFDAPERRNAKQAGLARQRQQNCHHKEYRAAIEMNTELPSPGGSDSSIAGEAELPSQGKRNRPRKGNGTA